MQKVNVNEIQARERQSPNGKFGRASKDISIALGRDPEVKRVYLGESFRWEQPATPIQ